MRLQDGRFNPCSNGMKKEHLEGNEFSSDEFSFNPCSNGMKKELEDADPIRIGANVLILVLME